MSWRDKVQAMRDGVNHENTPAHLPTKPTEPGCVSFGSTPLPPILKNQGAANDLAQVSVLVKGRAVIPPLTAEMAVGKVLVCSEGRAETAVTPEQDRWCWPHSSAMVGAEIDTFTQRLQQFTRRALTQVEAETLSDRLVLRDRDSDVRRLCLECLHLRGRGRWACDQWEKAGLGSSGVPDDLARQLQSCDAFMDSAPPTPAK